MGFFEKITGGLKKTRDSVMGQMHSMLGAFTRIDRDLFDELEEILIMSDVGTVTAALIRETLEERVKSERVTDPDAVRDLLKSTVSDLLRGDQELVLNTRPSVVLMIGVNGVGKTTTVGKMAHILKNQGKKVLLAAADTFRDAAIEQLGVWAERAKVDIVRHTQGADPGAVVFDAIAAAKARGCDVVLCDTAGRLHNKKHLMEELHKIDRIIDRELPGADKEVLLVLDATTGQNAVQQAREFREVAGITGIVLTKLDGTAKGGVVLALRGDLKVPVKFIGVGEGIDDLQPFDPDAFADGMFGG
ncbi:MAG: signal recognition particle-docking protein FtsY [Clostridia bacterium]|nr:signal recognition particle-docking protein FtsY [Clostridia bacterium]